jgi:hypothetical protein
MFFKTQTDSKAQVTTGQALRHLLVFQLKLGADALRDLLMSPIEDSLYLKLMLLGRKSDHLINLFDEHKDAGHFTVDQAIEELEELVRYGPKGSQQ